MIDTDPSDPELDFSDLYQAMCDGDLVTLEAAAALSDFPHGVDDFVGRHWLTNAVDAGNLATVQWVLSKGVAPTYHDGEGRSALTSTLEMERGFIGDNRTDTSIPSQKTPYVLAVIDALCDAGTDVNQSLTLDDTALHQAAMFSSVEVVRHLLARGADPLAICDDYVGRTPAGIAKGFKRWEVHAVLSEAAELASE